MPEDASPLGFRFFEFRPDGSNEILSIVDESAYRQASNQLMKDVGYGVTNAFENHLGKATEAVQKATLRKADLFDEDPVDLIGMTEGFDFFL